MPKRGATFDKRMGKADYKGSARSRKKAGEERKKGVGEKPAKGRKKGRTEKFMKKL